MSSDTTLADASYEAELYKKTHSRFKKLVLLLNSTAQAEVCTLSFKLEGEKKDEILVVSYSEEESRLSFHCLKHECYEIRSTTSDRVFVIHVDKAGNLTSDDLSPEIMGPTQNVSDAKRIINTLLKTLF